LSWGFGPIKRWDSIDNQYLNDHFKIGKLESWLEIPLDSAVTKGLKKRDDSARLPHWPGVKNLKPDISEKFQKFAAEYANKKRIARVHLDIYLWLENR
jgi:hypothetical protein